MTDSPNTSAIDGKDSRYNMRKRRRESPEKVEEVAAESAVETQAATIAEAMGLFANPPAAPQFPPNKDALPSVNDPLAIEAFFKRRRTCFKDLIPTCPNLFSDMKKDIPEDHPMKNFVEQNDQGMSVKEALARGFSNYKVRLPKQRRVIINNVAMPGAMPNAVRNDPQPSAAPQTMEEILAAINNAENADSGNIFEQEIDQQPQSAMGQLLERIKDEPQSPACFEAVDYPLPPFWKLNAEVFRGYKGGYFVNGEKYVQMTTLLHHNNIIVPVREPITFSVDAKEYPLTLLQLFAANGVVVKDATQMAELQAVFTSAGLLIHHRISEYLLNTFGPMSRLNPPLHIKREHIPIRLSLKVPPFACFRPNLFIQELGTVQGVNQILDASFGLPKPLTPTASDSQDSNLSARDELILVASVDSGLSLDTVAYRFGISVTEVEDILGRKEEIMGRMAKILMEDTPAEKAEAHKTINGDTPSSSKRRCRTRRPTFTGLNGRVWRFFKDSADRNLALNGKHLKDKAVEIALQMGYENFKGSEGWLDSFKKRHKIDFKTMSGVPADYEDEEGDQRMDVDENDENSTDLLDVKPLMGFHLPMLEEQAASGTMTIENTKPLDLGSFLTLTNGAEGSSGHVPAPALDERGFIAKIIESTALRVPDKEVNCAFDALRGYIMANGDLESLPLLVQLQQRLAKYSQTSQEPQPSGGDEMPREGEEESGEGEEKTSESGDEQSGDDDEDEEKSVASSQDD